MNSSFTHSKEKIDTHAVGRKRLPDLLTPGIGFLACETIGLTEIALHCIALHGKLKILFAPY
jgi:hypothetical protein